MPSWKKGPFLCSICFLLYIFLIVYLFLRLGPCALVEVPSLGTTGRGSIPRSTPWLRHSTVTSMCFLPPTFSNNSIIKLRIFNLYETFPNFLKYTYSAMWPGVPLAAVTETTFWCFDYNFATFPKSKIFGPILLSLKTLQGLISETKKDS